MNINGFSLQVKSALSGGVILLALVGGAAAGSQYGPGASDTEIKFGQNMPYSGPASIFSVQGMTLSAYFKMINDRGGIRGRKLNFISLDDGYSPSKAMEQARRLVENDEVLFIGASHGTPANMAIRPYLNAKKIPTIFAINGLAAMGISVSIPGRSAGSRHTRAKRASMRDTSYSRSRMQRSRSFIRTTT